MYRNMPDVMERAIARILLSTLKNCVQDKAANASNIVDIANKKDSPIDFFLLFKLANTIEAIAIPALMAIKPFKPLLDQFFKGRSQDHPRH
ncbi:hypothetical protein [Niallia sp. FSL R7-0271]